MDACVDTTTPATGSVQCALPSPGDGSGGAFGFTGVALVNSEFLGEEKQTLLG